MPIIVMCGSPCSGKTTRANELIEYFRSTNDDTDISIVNYEELGINRLEMYSNSLNERKGISGIKSSVERLVSKKRLVIVDYNNHIKSLRYEIFCRAKQHNTQYAVIYCSTSLEDCIKHNEQRKKSEQLTEILIKDLYQRMEYPDETKRWDQPLFTISPNDKLPFESIIRFIKEGVACKPGIATVPIRSENSSYLYELEQTCSAIIQSILTSQNQGLIMIGDSITVPMTNEKVLLTRSVQLAELRRMSSQFISIAKLRPPRGQQIIATAFVQHLNNALQIQI